ncbi:N-acetyltransferase [Clostridia bacterium]|nr:N-acetyltransferase [Clostridia bacterium]
MQGLWVISDGYIHIRKAVLTDAASLAEIQSFSWAAAYAEIIPDEAIQKQNLNRRERWESILSGAHNTFIAFLGDKPAGFAGLSPCRDEGMAYVGEIVAIYLHPAYWRKGIGRYLLRFSISWLREQGYAEVVLWTLEDNVSAHRFYEACGMYKDGGRKELTIGKPLSVIRFSMLQESIGLNPDDG